MTGSVRPVFLIGPARDFLSQQNSRIVFGLGFLGDVLLICQGGLERNIFFAWTAIAATIGMGLMMLPGLLQFRLGEARVKQWEARMKRVAGPIHNTAGLAMICSRIGWGGTGFSISELVFGACSFSGSMMQFWGDYILQLCSLTSKGIFRRLDGSKLAGLFYSIVVPSIFFDAMRLHAPLLYTAFACYLPVLIGLAIRGRDHNEREVLP